LKGGKNEREREREMGTKQGSRDCCEVRGEALVLFVSGQTEKVLAYDLYFEGSLKYMCNIA